MSNSSIESFETQLFVWWFNETWIDSTSPAYSFFSIKMVASRLARTYPAFPQARPEADVLVQSTGGRCQSAASEDLTTTIASRADAAQEDVIVVADGSDDKQSGKTKGGKQMWVSR